MKTRKLFFAGLAALAFAACSNDELVLDGNTPGGPSIEESGEPTWVNLKLSVASGARSRAAVPTSGKGDTIDVGNVKDEVIKDVTILVFNATSKVLENKEELTFTNGAAEKKNFLATPGNKKIYAIANITDTLKKDGSGNKHVDKIWREIQKMKVKDSTLDDYLKLVYNLPATGGLDSLIMKNSHVMSSTDEKPDFTIKAGVTSDNTADNIVKLELNYMVAKVGVKLASDDVASNILGAEGTLSYIYYTLRNIAKDTYLTQKYPVKGVHYAWAPTDKTDVTGWTEKFWVPSVVDNLAISTKISSYFLALENVNDAPVIGNTTYVAIQGTFVPTHAVTAVVWNELTKKVVPTKGGLPAQQSTFYVSAIQNVPDIPAGTIFASEELMKKAYALHQSNGADTIPTGWEANMSTEYTNGKCWYRMNIGKGKDEYGIERGKIYNITINKITGLGYNSDAKLDGSEEGGYTPDLPLTQETYINATVTVKGWEEINQEGELN